jgi:glutamyl-tRNA reductase
VTHLYNVTAGLDSQLLGDYEILAQVKNAYKRAKDHGRSGSFTERLVNSCIQASKAVKTNTKLSSGTVSVSFAAIQYIKQHAQQLAGKKIVLAGTGKIGKSTSKNLLHYTDFKDITLINRTEETAQALAEECSIAWAPYQALGAEVAAADVVIVSTNSPTPIINLSHVNAAKPQLFIDLSVPCNVDPNVTEAGNVSLVNVDALSKLNDETLAARREEIPAAMRIIHTHQLEFLDWLHMRQFAPILKQVKLKLNEMTAEQWYKNAGYSVPNADATIQNVINVLATKIKNTNAAGCHYIEAINDYIACHGETY